MVEAAPCFNYERQATEWLQRHAVVIDTTTPRDDHSDLLPLKGIIGDATVVGLGEATHGTKEFIDIKNRTIRFLIEEMGFDTVMCELVEEHANKLDNFIKGGNFEVDIFEELKPELWKTEELRSFVNWLREYNRTAEKQVSLLSFDIDNRKEVTDDERDKEMAQNVLNHVEENPESKVVLWAHDGHIRDEDAGYKSQGSYLRERLGDQYFPVGMLTNRGSVLAREGTWQNYGPERKVLPFGPVAVDRSYEKIFSDTGLPLTFVNLRQVRKDESLRALYDPNRTRWWIGFSFDPATAENTSETPFAKSFDGAFWVEESSAATPLAAI